MYIYAYIWIVLKVAKTYNHPNFVHMQWIMNVIKHVEHHNRTRLWSAEVVVALATFIRTTASRFYDPDTNQIMLSYLCLGKEMCQYIVNKMDKSARLVLVNYGTAQFNLDYTCMWQLHSSTCFWNHLGYCLRVHKRSMMWTCTLIVCVYLWEAFPLLCKSFLYEQCMCICFARNALVRFAILHESHLWGCLCVLGCINSTHAFSFARPACTCIFHIASRVIPECSKLSTCVRTY